MCNKTHRENRSDETCVSTSVETETDIEPFRAFCCPKSSLCVAKQEGTTFESVGSPEIWRAHVERLKQDKAKIRAFFYPFQSDEEGLPLDHYPFSAPLLPVVYTRNCDAGINLHVPTGQCASTKKKKTKPRQHHKKSHHTKNKSSFSSIWIRKI